mgnify:CR=1 FL=1|tara:strand:- start:21367 stop:21618 length:252 start_codon:yes stop_codon:yes gene_type:complete
MIYSDKELKAKLQSLLEQGHVDEAFVEDIRDLLMSVDNEPYECEELFQGTLEALESLNIDVQKHRESAEYLDNMNNASHATTE